MNKMDLFLHKARSTLPTPKWSDLKQYGTSRILRSSYYWILVVPVVARVLRNVRGPYTISVFHSPLTLELVLPFSWQMFYWSAVCIGVATLIYSVRCPELIREYSSFASFAGPGRGQRQLFDMLRELLLAKHVWRSNNWPIRAQTWLRDFLILGARGDRTRAVEEMTILKEEDRVTEQALDQMKIIPARDVLTRAFWFARSMAEWSRFWSRTLCAVFYLLGLSLFMIVLVQNAAYVCSWGIEFLWPPA
jgi:hypothetical protein